MKYADNLFFPVVFMLFSLSFLSAGGNLFSDEYPSWLTWKPDPRAVKSGLYVVPKPPAGKATVSFKVIEPSGAARMSWPVRGSIPLFRGELKDPSLIRLKDSSGKQIPVQGRATAFWPEKTVRFLCIDFVTDIKAGEEKSCDCARNH